MESHLILVILSVAVMISEISLMTHAAVPKTIMKHIGRVNKNGPYLGIVVPNAFEMDPLLQSPSLVVDHDLPYFDFSGLSNLHILYFCVHKKMIIDICHCFTFLFSFFFLLFYRSTVSIWTYKRQESYNCNDRTKHGILMNKC